MISIKRILYPFDRSHGADEALLYSVAMASAYSAKLYLCNCVDSLAGLSSEERRKIEGLFEEKLRSSQVGNSKEVDWDGLILEGDPAEAISRAAAEKQIELIVMKSRGRPLEATLLGSTAEAVCRTAPCSVMVAHEGERAWIDPAANGTGLKRVLVAYDFSDDSEIGLRYALSLADSYEAELHMLYVLPPRLISRGMDQGDVPIGLEIEFREAVRRLEGALPSGVHQGNNVRLTVRAGQPYREVLSYAREQAIDLILMGVHGAGHGINSLFGSNVDRVMRQAPCPVLIARPLRPINQEFREYREARCI